MMHSEPDDISDKARDSGTGSIQADQVRWSGLNFIPRKHPQSVKPIVIQVARTRTLQIAYRIQV